jgi:hypothetical protein
MTEQAFGGGIMGDPSFRLSNPRRIGKGTLIGAFDLDLIFGAFGMKLSGVMLHAHSTSGKQWIAFPAKEWLKNGKPEFSKLFEPTSDEAREFFSKLLLAAAEKALGLQEHDHAA